MIFVWKKGFTYILTNKNAAVLYVGATKNLKNRVDCHRNGTGVVFSKNIMLQF
ncbi:GIY-YIG nuclease family protein [Flavobacterium sp. LB3P122]|uniref:GIY-YIG nuclease family protein n=1 Tax=Flavobacterium algoriphilum TaxID=3398738 RepID=UPI003A83B795